MNATNHTATAELEQVIDVADESLGDYDVAHQSVDQWASMADVTFESDPHGWLVNGTHHFAESDFDVALERFEVEVAKEL